MQTTETGAPSYRSGIIRKASLVAIAGNAALAAGKIIIGLTSGSLAVVGDGIDSSTDVLISLITLLAARIIDKPGDVDHPYGHTRAETIATVLLAFIIFFAGAQLLLSTIHSFAEPVIRIPNSITLWITGFSILGKLALALSQFHWGKLVGSSMLVANGKNMRNDILISSGVLVGLFFVFVLKLPILDRITAILLSFWVMKTSLGIFLEVNVELMDGNTDTSLYDCVFKAVRSVAGAGNPHRVRIRKLSSSVIVDIDIEVAGSKTVNDAHAISIAVEQAVKAAVDNVYDVMVHIEPEGNVELGERFGLDERMLKESGKKPAIKP